jgi:DNA uptake protein ComE-like DNA-binding protein
MQKLLATTLALILALTFGTCAFAADTKAPAKPAAPAAPAADKKAEPAKPAAKAEPLDINTATEEQLKSIAGIGDAYAKKIIAGRPYAKKDQLKSKKIIPADLYEKIKEQIIAKQPKK